MPTHLLTIAEVAARTTLSRSEIYRRMAQGTFPPAIKLGPRRIAFLAEDIETWIEARVQDTIAGGRAHG